MSEESTTPDLVERVRQMVEVDSFTEWETLAEQLYAPNVVWNMGELLHGALRALLPSAPSSGSTG